MDALLPFWPYDAWIPKDDLVIDADYLCEARNFEIGKWNGECFEYIRYKLGTTFPDTELHWDEGPPHGTVKPFKLMEKSCNF